MKRLLELMIEKCKKQATQIAIYDATIEKMDDLNVLTLLNFFLSTHPTYIDNPNDKPNPNPNPKLINHVLLNPTQNQNQT
eukprot:Pgem_evm1s9235